MNYTYKILTVLLILFFLIGLIYNYETNTYVTAEFKNLRPFHDRAPIYYNGFKIGKVVKVKPNKQYTSTIVTMRLHPQDLKLPTNISAHLKKEKNKNNDKFDYIDIILPDKPSGFYLKDGDRIAGKNTVEFESFLSNQDPESLEAIKADVAESVKSLNITIQTIGDLFTTLNSMAEDVKPNVVKASYDLSETTSNFVGVSKNANSITNNLNTSFDANRMNTTAKNVQLTSRNIKLITHELNEVMPQIQCAILELNKILSNTEGITSGLNCTMQKPFGGFRLIFGSPVGTKNCGCK